MNPMKVGEGSVSVGLARRISVSAVVNGKVTLVILGSRVNDVLIYVEVGDGTFELKDEVNLSGRDGKIPDAATDVWQDFGGHVFRGLGCTYVDWLFADAVR